MKRKIVLLFFILQCIATFAHDSAIPVEKGHIRTSLYMSITGGASYNTFIEYDSDGIPIKMTFLPITSEYDFSLGSSVFLLEYGITDFLSIGLDLDLFGFISKKITYDRWQLYAAGYIRADLLRNTVNKNLFNIHFVSKCFASPLFATPTQSDWMGDGLITFFNTMSFNYRFLEKEKISLFVYMDVKHITTVINEDYGSQAFDVSTYINSANLTTEQIESIETAIGSMNRIAICPGIEMTWGKFNAYLGFNIPILEYSINPQLTTWIDVLFDDIYFNNIDIGCNFRF